MPSLIELLYRNSLPTLTKRLRAGENPNESDAGESLLHGAIDREKWSLVTLLLQCGASPNLSGVATPLGLAATKGRRSVIRELIAAGADLEGVDEEGGTALMNAAAMGFHQIVADLLEAGAHPKTKDRHGRTALLYAADKGHDAVVELLFPLSSKKDQQAVERLRQVRAQSVDPEDVHALLCAAHVGTLALVKDFLADRVPVDASKEDGVTPLMWAANGGRISVVKFLVEAGAEVNRRTPGGECALDYAAMAGNAEAYDYLHPLTAKTLRKRAEREREEMISCDRWKLPEVWD